MRTRILIHFLDGSTFKGKWEEYPSKKYLVGTYISSIQIQEEEGKLHTLSSKLKKVDILRFKENLNFKYISRKLEENLWLELRLDTNNGDTEIYIIKEEVNA
jgi:hypothetical protein